MKDFIVTLKQLLVAPKTFDPDDLRRRQVLNTVLLFLLFVDVCQGFLALWDVGPVLVIQGDIDYDFLMIFVTSIIVLILSIFLLILNHSSRTPRDLAGWILVMGMLVVVAISDSPFALTEGRSIFMWAIPISLSIIVLPPASVFIVDLIITIAFSYYAEFTWRDFQIYTLIELYIVSFFSWLGMMIAERAIRDARNESQTNRAVLDGVADGVVVVGMDNKINLTNPVAEELVDGEMIKILPAAESAEIGGRVLSLRWSNVPGVGRVAIIRDVSRQVEIEHAKDAVLGVVSHEMRTPLAAIMGLTEVLTSTSMTSSYRLERIRANAQRMMALVNDLLDQAHIEAGVLKMHNENFSPSSLTNAIQDSFCARSKDKSIALSILISESLPELLVGDLHRYQQILANLVDNAIKFTKEGGRVDVLLTLCDNDTDKWQMVISDTGMGIPPERLPDIFLPFRRASDYAKRNCQGVGLGLSIAKRIAQLAHGDIQVKSMVGHGTTFIVTLPIHGGV